MGKIRLDEELATPDTPPAGKRIIYAKSDGFYELDSAGNEKKIAGATSLDELTDVTITGTPVDSANIRYNATSGQWENALFTSDIFGCSFAETSNAVFDSNGSSSYENHSTLVASQCEAGKKYRIGVFAIWNSSTTSNDVEIQITVDEGSGEVQLGRLKVEAKEAGTDNEVPDAGFFYYTPSTSGDVTLRINYRMQDGTGTAYMFYSAIEWWRVGL